MQSLLVIMTIVIMSSVHVDSANAREVLTTHVPEKLVVHEQDDISERNQEARERGCSTEHAVTPTRSQRIENP